MILLPLVLALAQQPTQPSQLPPLPAARTDTSPFRRLELPTPSLLREGSGRPGPAYWQQRVDYTIAVSLDTARHTIAGRETIRYTNRSPDTLRYIWLQLDQNIFRDDSRGALLNPPDARFAARGFKGGFVLDGVRTVGLAGRRAVRGRALKTTENGTLMRVELDPALPPRGVTSLEIGYSFQVPEHGADRMGREQFPEGWLYEIAQWYPRLAVYDDIRGWNTEQYLGQGEFYLEYGDIDFAITVPRGFIVAATGRLTNPLQVLTAQQRERLERHSDAVVLSAGRRFHLAGIDAHGPAFDPALFGEMVPVPLSDRDQRQRSRRRDGVSDAGLLRQPAQPRGAVRRDDTRARPPVVPDGRRQQRAAVRLDGRRVQHLHQYLFDAHLLPEPGMAAHAWASRAMGAVRGQRP